MQNIKRNSIVLLVMILTVLPLMSQNVDEVIQKVINRYATDAELSMNLQFNLFYEEGSKITESINAEYLKLGDDYFTKIYQTEMLIKDDLFIKVNHNQKLIQYIKTTTNSNPITQSLDIEALNKMTKNKSVTKKNNLTIITLILNPKSINPYAKVVMYIDSQSYRILKQIFYFKEKNLYQFNSKNTGKARLEIDYSNIKNKIPITKKIFFKINNYIIEKAGVLKPASRLSNYEVITS